MPIYPKFGYPTPQSLPYSTVRIRKKHFKGRAVTVKYKSSCGFQGDCLSDCNILNKTQKRFKLTPEPLLLLYNLGTSFTYCLAVFGLIVVATSLIEFAGKFPFFACSSIKVLLSAL